MTSTPKDLRKCSRPVRGFTLLEALVAMAIAAIAFTALYRAVGQSSKVVVDVDARVQAATLAKSVFDSATFAEDVTAVQEGHAAPWHWRAQVVPDALPLQDLNGQLVDPPTVVAARVEVVVSRDGASTPTVTWSGWKPYRKAP